MSRGGGGIAEAPTFFDPLERLQYHYFPYAEGRTPERRWFCKPDPSARTHHLHLVEAGSAHQDAVLTFRDFLRQDRDEAARYESLKRTLASGFLTDREAYTEGKTEFIRGVLERRRSPAREREQNALRLHVEPDGQPLRRAARSAQELKLGDLQPLDVALLWEDDCPGIAPDFVGQDRLELSANGLRVPTTDPQPSDIKEDREDASAAHQRSSPLVAPRGQSGGNEETLVDPIEKVLADGMAAALACGDLTRAELFCRELTARREARAGPERWGADPARAAG